LNRWSLEAGEGGEGGEGDDEEEDECVCICCITIRGASDERDYKALPIHAIRACVWPRLGNAV
jgi:hypothetical protein